MIKNLALIGLGLFLTYVACLVLSHSIHTLWLFNLASSVMFLTGCALIAIGAFRWNT